MWFYLLGGDVKSLALFGTTDQGNTRKLPKMNDNRRFSRVSFFEKIGSSKIGSKIIIRRFGRKNGSDNSKIGVTRNMSGFKSRNLRHWFSIKFFLIQRLTPMFFWFTSPPLSITFDNTEDT